MTGTTKAALRMRSGPGGTNTIVAIIPKGAIVTLAGPERKGWYPVSYGGNQGWCSAAFITIAPASAMTADKARAALLTYLRIPYIWGGQSRDGLDCSGLVGEWWKEIGFKQKGFDTTADKLFDGYRSGQLRGRKLENGQFGALAFYGHDATATHVAVCYDAIVAVGANYGTKTTKSKTTAYDRGAMVQFAPIAYRNDLLGIWMPDYGWS